MFATINAIGTMIQSLTNSLTTVFESGNDIAKIGRVKTMTLLRDELQDAGDLRQLKEELAAIGLEELSTPVRTIPKPRTQPKS